MRLERRILAFLLDDAPEAIDNAIISAIKSTGFDHFILALESVFKGSLVRDCSKMGCLQMLRKSKHVPDSASAT